MAIQILGLRDYIDKDGNTRKSEKFFEKEWRAKSVADLFLNLDERMAKIPDDERYNLYYTAASCFEKKGRNLEYQNVIPIDVDGIDTNNLDAYINVILILLRLDINKTGIVATGNGLQFLIQIEEPIDDVEYFDDHRLYYRALCGEINNALYNEGLCGNADTSVFSGARLLRLPSTLNIKPEKGEKKAILLQSVIETQNFDLLAASGVPIVDHDQSVSKGMLDRLPPPDTKGVTEGCDFLKHCALNPDTIDEPQWYAMLSIIGRLEDGKNLAHAYSQGHPQYSESHTNNKLAQSIEASGPRTCENISSLWEGCPSCKNYDKCKSPIVLQSAEYIKTKDTGFYNVGIDKDGQPKKGKPNYDDLMKHFSEIHSFLALETGGHIYTHSGTHWEDCTVARIKSFAEQNFDPKPMAMMRGEFVSKLQCNNIRHHEWFNNTTGLINFANGVLDANTKELRPHDERLGFKYVLPFEYDPEAKCPAFDSLMSRITCGIGGLENTLLEYMGFALSGMDASKISRALILTGDGSNGKSVFMDVLKHLAGKDNYSALSMGREIDKLENRHQLDGKLFNVSEETPTNAMMENSIFKVIVAGGEIQARKLYCDAYPLKNNAKIIMACNELPLTKDMSDGMFRRLLIVPFNAKFGPNIAGFDPLIRDKMYAEASGIYNRAIEAFIKLKERGHFNLVDEVQAKIEEYKMQSDPIAEWWRDEVLEDGVTVLPVNTFYQMYRGHCELGGIKAVDVRVFSRSLSKLGINKTRITHEGKQQACIKGFKIQEG